MNWKDKINYVAEFPGRQVKLIIDGHNISFSTVIYKRKVTIQWFVDNVWKGIYMHVDSEIGAKFGEPFYIRNTPTQIKIERLLRGPKSAKSLAKRKTLIGYRNYWTSPRNLIRHLSKTCTKIEIIEE